MEHGARESFKEQLQMEKIMKTEVEAATTYPTHIDIEIDLNHFKQEPGLVQFMQNEPALLVKEEVVEDSSQDKDGSKKLYAKGAAIPAGPGSVNGTCGTSLNDFLSIKHEPVDLDIGPTVLQHMDVYYKINKNAGVATDGNSTADGWNEAMPGSGIKKESIGNVLRGNKTSCKYCGQKTKGDCYEAHVKYCLGKQKKFQQHPFCATSSYGSKSSKTNHKPHLLSVHNKRHQLKSRKISEVTGTTVIGTSDQSRDETAKTNLFECNICEKRFSSKASLTQHMRAQHMGMKPYQCDMCDATFVGKSNFIRHMKVHTGEKPYHCNNCDARFAQRDSLTRHMRVHTGEKPHQCINCDAKFSQRGALTQHMKVHTGEKPYKCEMCEAKFAQRGGLTQHMRIHTGEKPYQCDHCEAKFAQRGALNRHARVHTGEKPYQRNNFEGRFPKSGTLIRHTRNQNMGVSPRSVTNAIQDL